jgi:hypothetical protein
MVRQVSSDLVTMIGINKFTLLVFEFDFDMELTEPSFERHNDSGLRTRLTDTNLFNFNQSTD